MTKGTKNILYFMGGVMLLVVVSVLVAQWMKIVNVEIITSRLGLWGPLFLLIGIIIGGIIIPISSLPFLIAGLTLYGFWQTLLIYYLGSSLIAPIIDYWLAQQLGRPAVIKLAGRKSLARIDRISEVIGTKILVIIRLIGGILYESISFAAGLAKYDFKKYLLATLVLPIPSMLLNVYLIGKGLSHNPSFLVIVSFWWYFTGLLTTWLVYKEEKSIT